MDARAWLTHWASLSTDGHRQQLFVALLTEHEACEAARAEAEQRAEQALTLLRDYDGAFHRTGRPDLWVQRLNELLTEREAQSAHGSRDDGT